MGELNILNASATAQIRVSGCGAWHLHVESSPSDLNMYPSLSTPNGVRTVDCKNRRWTCWSQTGPWFSNLGT